MNYLIDRRLNGRNKSAVNRERFIRRYKEHIRRSVKGMIAERSITDMAKGGDVKVPAKDISEPGFRYGAGGDWESVHPGNKEFVRGDKIPRPEGGGGGGGGNQSGTGESVDDFVFTLSREEFLNIFFEDLELPNLMRTAIAEAEDKKLVRAGFVKEGTPANLSVGRTMKTALARRIALGGPLREELEQTREALQAAARAGQPQARIVELESRILDLEGRLARLPFLDDVDLRYRHRVAVPKPAARAVMFCLMDVSASMDERKKDLAKRFFTLLYLFLTRKYERVELVFIRHTDEAQEVDEDTFFYDTQSGGTVVYSALELMQQICEARYQKSDWNIYAAQASDGDAFGADPAKSARFLREQLLPLTRYFAYIECPDENQSGSSSLWVEYEEVKNSDLNFAMRRVSRPQEIYPVFRDLFRKEKV
ncbi:MAG TPA: YeaH/YhbH family protein [Burkholderiales bacterium]|nr:YeaH/YhbH family protein [Burkholderiales bacterium]